MPILAIKPWVWTVLGSCSVTFANFVNAENLRVGLLEAEKEYCLNWKNNTLWENNQCRCKYRCVTNDPICDNLKCYGAPVISRKDGRVLQYSYSRCDYSKCPFGQIGECCEKETCKNGGIQAADWTCNCNGTGFMGEACDVRIKICRNGGTRDEQRNECDCAEPYMGDECEKLWCYNDFETLNGTCGCQQDSRFSGRLCEKIRCERGTPKVEERDKISHCLCGLFHTGRFCESLSDAAKILLPVIALVISGLLIALVWEYGIKRRQPDPLEDNACSDQIHTNESDNINADYGPRDHFASGSSDIASEENVRLASLYPSAPPSYETAMKYY